MKFLSRNSVLSFTQILDGQSFECFTSLRCGETPSPRDFLLENTTMRNEVRIASDCDVRETSYGIILLESQWLI